MDSAHRHKWQYAALGGACALAVSLAYLHRRNSARKRGNPERQSLSKASETGVRVQASAPAHVPASLPARQSSAAAGKAKAAAGKAKAKAAATHRSEDVTAKSLEDLEAWAAGLKKRDSQELPTLLVSMEKLLQEQPQHKALPSCLKALAQMVGGHQEGDRVSAVAVKAGANHPEKAFEVLNALFKDRRQRGGYVADSEVVAFALETLRKSIKGEVERGTYQRACRLVDWLSLDPENRASLAAQGGFETLLEVMQRFHDDPGVMLEGCGTLQSLAVEPFLDAEKAASVAISCLQTFPENPELQWRALAALHALALPATEAKLPIAKLAALAVTKHPRCDTTTTVVEWAAKLLHKFAKERDSQVRTWLKEPAQKPWLEELREAPLAARGKVNIEAEFWVKELCRLCG